MYKTTAYTVHGGEEQRRRDRVRATIGLHAEPNPRHRGVRRPAAMQHGPGRTAGFRGHTPGLQVRPQLGVPSRHADSRCWRTLRRRIPEAAVEVRQRWQGGHISGSRRLPGRHRNPLLVPRRHRATAEAVAWTAADQSRHSRLDIHHRRTTARRLTITVRKQKAVGADEAAPRPCT